MIDKDPDRNRRVLIVDDNESIHADFRKILAPDTGTAAMDAEEAELFGTADVPSVVETFEVDSAYQGQEALARVQEAVREGRPYAMAFVDVRMPPGWDGIETIGRIWAESPDLQVVLCTAYSDYSWDEMIAKLGSSDQFLILKKPFDNIEACQLACALTEKWNLVRELRGQMDDLEQAVQARTHELQTQKRGLQETVEKLHQAQSQLLQADKMASIGQLAAGVAHEINNPIGFISSNLNSLGQYVEDLKDVLTAHEGLLDTCRQHPDLTTQVEQVQCTRQEKDIDYVVSDVGNLITESVEGAQRVRRIVADLRDFSHVDSPEVTEEDLNALLDKTVNVAWNELKYKTEVVKEYGQIPPISCYGGKLGQVFLNLLVNAAQAIKERGTVTIRTGRQADRVWIEVADTGCGIPPENLKRVFDPFFTTKDVGKGTGLGLHLAYTIVQAHGGHITAQSTVGKGTTFRIELPTAGPPEATEKQNEHTP